MYNYFILGFQGFEYFKKNYNKEMYSKTNLRIIDNGNQNIDGFQNYKTTKNIGCAGGWNLICYIGFQYLGLEKIIIGQEDITTTETEMNELLEKCNESTISALIQPNFEFAVFALHKKTYIKIGLFDENCIDAYCEDADYKQRCYLNNIKIESLNTSNSRNLGLSRRVNTRIFDTITVNRLYIKDKWGNSINKNELFQQDQQPPYEFKFPFNRDNLDTKFIPVTDRMKRIHNLSENQLPSQEEILKFLTNPQAIKK